MKGGKRSEVVDAMGHYLVLLLCDEAHVVVTGDADEVAVEVGLDGGHSGVVVDEGEFSEALAFF